ncbi:MAG: redoxin domain-containing protein, partial [Bacteroidales bacterium]|nr:redoxin domain-containing protein [Bacteroidales bacterium]
DELIYTSLGKTAKDLVLKTIDNKQINLHDIDSKFLVVWFWEPDCDICDELTISLNQNRAELNKIGAKILAINIGSEQEKWINYTRDNDLQFINTWNSEAFNDFQKYYGANRTPRLYVLNADKKILAKDLQPAGLPKYIQYLNKNN